MYTNYEEIEILKAEKEELLKQLQERNDEINVLTQKIDSLEKQLNNITYETEINCPSEEVMIAQANIFAQFGY